MSSENYYTSITSSNIPYVTVSVLQTLKYHICTTLYPEEDYTTSQRRFLLASFDSNGTEEAIRKSIEKFEDVQGGFPFTAYSIGNMEEKKENVTMQEKLGVYSEYFEKYIKSMNVTFEVPMMSIFTTPHDYSNALTLLIDLSNKLQRLIVPITINGKDDVFYADVEMTPTKGSLAFNEVEQNQRGELYDIEHNCNISLRAIIIPDIEINPVDNIELAIKSMPKKGDESMESSISLQRVVAYDTPEILTTLPENNAVDVSINKTNTLITINFNSSMDEMSVFNSLSYNNDLNFDTVWDVSSTQLKLALYENLENATEYRITIKKQAKSIYQQEMENDYIFSFTTED